MTTSLHELSAQDFPGTHPVQEQLRFLLRYAILAPSTRNTQPWRFRVEENRVLVLADRSRAHPVADRDGRELYLSLGCALENLLVAAEQFGFAHRVAYLPLGPEDDTAAVVTFLPAGTRSPERRALSLGALIERRTVHGRFLASPVSDADAAALRDCATEPDLELVWLVDPDRRASVQGLHRTASEVALADPAFRAELADWVGQGAFGTPWPLARLGRTALTHEAVARQLAGLDAAAIQSAPTLALISSCDDDRMSQLRSGQLLERLWLTAASRGLGLQPLSAALELPPFRYRLTRLMEARLPWAQQLVRIGHPTRSGGHQTPRRPLEEVVESAGVAR